MTGPNQQTIRAAVLAYLDEHLKQAKANGIPSREVAAGVAKKLPRRYRNADWRRALWAEKGSLVAKGALVAIRGVWRVKACPHNCDECTKMCKYTGEHYERHKCRVHM